MTLRFLDVLLAAILKKGQVGGITGAYNTTYTWVERGTVGVKCLAQEHNIMSRARARTRTAQFRDERTNGEVTHWASENEKWVAQKENLHVPNDWTTLFSSPEL